METAKPSLSPSIKQVWQYTNRVLPNRFDNFKRDVLPSKIRIINKKIYNRDRIDQFDEKLEIISESFPQYEPYLSIKGEKSKRQRKIRHEYDIVMQLSKDKNDEYSWDSPIRWRVGSYKKWDVKPPKSKIATISWDERKKLKEKLFKQYSDEEEEKEVFKDKIKHHKNTAKFLDVSDYNSREKGLNGDNYFLCQPLQYKKNALYGPLVNTDNIVDNPKIKYPFFCKHMIGVILFLFKKKILKGSLL